MDKDTKSVQKFFDDLAGSYDERTSRNRYQIPAWVEARVQKGKPAQRVLDLACGNGNIGVILRKHLPQAHLCGVDLSQGMVDETMNKGIYQEVRQYDLGTGLPPSVVGGAPFDLVLAFGFLELLENPHALLSAIAQALGSEGRVWIGFEKDSADNESERSKAALDFTLYPRDLDTVRGLVEAAGMRVADSEEFLAYHRSFDDKQIYYWMLELEHAPKG